MARLLGFDIGTTATKAVLLDEERGAVAGAERSAALVSPRAGWAEMDPAAWWRNVCELARELAAGGPPTAVGVAGMVPCTLLLDVEGRPAARARSSRTTLAPSPRSPSCALPSQAPV